MEALVALEQRQLSRLAGEAQRQQGMHESLHAQIQAGSVSSVIVLTAVENFVAAREALENIDTDAQVLDRKGRPEVLKQLNALRQQMDWLIKTYQQEHKNALHREEEREEHARMQKKYQELKEIENQKQEQIRAAERQQAINAVAARLKQIETSCEQEWKACGDAAWRTGTTPVQLQAIIGRLETARRNLLGGMADAQMLNNNGLPKWLEWMQQKMRDLDEFIAMVADSKAKRERDAAEFAAKEKAYAVTVKEADRKRADEQKAADEKLKIMQDRLLHNQCVYCGEPSGLDHVCGQHVVILKPVL